MGPRAKPCLMKLKKGRMFRAELDQKHYLQIQGD